MYEVKEMKEIKILFCDDRPGRHEIFKARINEVIRTRKKALEVLKRPDHKILVYHSCGLEGSQHCPADWKGTADCNWMQGDCTKWQVKPVKTWLEEGEKFDLVITDINFEDGARGHRRKGFEIARYIFRNGSLPSTQFLLLTAYGDYIFIENEARKNLIEMQEGPITSLKNWLDFEGDPDKFSNDFGSRILTLIEDCIQEREKYDKVIKELIAPETYKIKILHRDPFWNDLGVIISEKKTNGRKMSLKLRAQRLEFWILAEKPQEYITEEELARRVKEIEEGHEKYEKLSPKERINILQKFGVNLKSENPPCNIMDDNLCNYATGNELPHPGKQGSQCQNVSGYCVKELYQKVRLESQIKEQTIRARINQVRKKVSEKKVNLSQPIPKENCSKDVFQHKENIFCGYCLIHHREKGKAGYALAASVEKIKIPKDKSIEDAIKEHLAIGTSNF